MNRKYINNTLDTERNTLHLSDDEKRFAIIDTLTVENGEELDPYQVTIRYQYDNHLGSACLELDNAGQIIFYEEYHPFGTTSYRSGRSQTEVSLKRYKYCGKERDEETGLYYYGMRYYAAWICRFVSVDPLQFKYPHYTPYQYAGNKPISYIDLDGTEEWSISANITAENTVGKYSATLNGNIYGPYANEKAAFEAAASGAKLYNTTISNIKTINDSQKKLTFLDGMRVVYDNSDISFDVIQNLNYFIDHPFDATVDLADGIMNTLAGLLNPQTYYNFFSGIYEMTQTSAYQNGMDFALANKNIITSTMTTAPLVYVGGAIANTGSLSMRFSYSAANTTTVSEVAANSGWKVGESITNLTTKGNVPTWSAVRQCFWKNEAFFSKSGEYTEFNMFRMQKGLAPQFRNTTTGVMESIELHHTIPQRNGGLFEFIKVTPDQHRLIDPFRR